MSLDADAETLADHLRVTLGAEAKQVSVIEGFARVDDLTLFMAYMPCLLVSIIETNRDGQLTTATVQVTLLTRPNTATVKTKYSENLRIKDQVEAALLSAPVLAPGSAIRWRSIFTQKPSRALGVSVGQFVYTARVTTGPDPDTFEPWTKLYGEMTFAEGDDDGAGINHEVDLPQ